MDKKKLPTDFKVKASNTKAMFNPFNTSTIALSITLLLFFFTKFVWSPFKRGRNYQEAEEASAILYKYEQEVKNSR